MLLPPPPLPLVPPVEAVVAAVAHVMAVVPRSLLKCPLIFVESSLQILGHCAHCYNISVQNRGQSMLLIHGINVL